MENGLISYRHNVGQSVYHVIWCPKYRFNMFRKPGTARECEAVLRGIAARHGLRVVELFVMPDHVHLVVGVPPTMAPSKAFQLLKGGSAYELFKAHPNMRKRYPRGHLWSPGTCFRSVGDADLETVKQYVRTQADRHQHTLAEYTTGYPGL